MDFLQKDARTLAALVESIKSKSQITPSWES